jgi:Leucine-rich repeat (LRR) protein
LKHLVALQNLTTLTLGNTPVTDAGLREMAALPNLTTLDVSDTKVTDAGVGELRLGLPNCQIRK